MSDNNDKQSLGVILGSAFEKEAVDKLMLQPVQSETSWGTVTLYRSELRKDRSVYVHFRHGLPHSLLPNQINYRAQAAAFHMAGCGALLINSSVGVLDPEIPLYKPMLVTDLLMPENRLPDGSTCTMYPEPTENQGHLLLREGLFSKSLNLQIAGRHNASIYNPDDGLVFVYAGGPRSKTFAENRMWARLGGQVNSMTLAPEVVLANELKIPVSALVVGHKYSVPDKINPETEAIAQTLEHARAATEKILIDFICHGEPVSFKNQIYRY